MKLYSFPTSSASYRVRIALHLKGIPFETVDRRPAEQGAAPGAPTARSTRSTGCRRSSSTTARSSPSRWRSSTISSRSIPEPPVYPSDPVMRARALAVALIIASEIQPLNNSSVTDYVRDTYGMDQAGIDKWMAHCMRAGFAAIEQLIDGSHYCLRHRADASPTSAWCRRSSTPTATRSTSPISRRSTRSPTSPTPTRPSPRRIRAGSRARLNRYCTGLPGLTRILGYRILDWHSAATAPRRRPVGGPATGKARRFRARRAQRPEMGLRAFNPDGGSGRSWRSRRALALPRRRATSASSSKRASSRSSAAAPRRRRRQSPPIRRLRRRSSGTRSTAPWPKPGAPAASAAS